jgi:hypothetical protein
MHEFYIFIYANYNWEVNKFYYIILFSSFYHIVKWWFRLIIFNVDADNNFKCTLLHNNWHLLLRSRHKVKFVYKGSITFSNRNVNYIFHIMINYTLYSYSFIYYSVLYNNDIRQVMSEGWYITRMWKTIA